MVLLLIITFLLALPLSVSAQNESVKSDSIIILEYGYQAIDTITASQSPSTFRQIREAESMLQGITDQKAKNRAVVDYVLTHPDSDGSV